jgi:hypothetical protein
MRRVSRRDLLLPCGAALVGAAATESKANAKTSPAKPETAEVGSQEGAYLMPDPIEVLPGVYTMPGEPEIMGLCVMIDYQEAQWEVTHTAHYGTVIRIKNGSKWNVQEYSDPNTSKRKLQIFREGAKLNSLELKRPTEEEYSPNGDAADNEESRLRIFYTTPEDGHTPPIIAPAR